MISIIVPTYNSSATLRNCLDSIICQTINDYEVLIMDGCSNDDTITLVKSYNNDHIRVFSEPDRGIYDAMNKGIDKAKGDWLYFLGSDDSLSGKDALLNISEYLTSDYDVVYGDVYAPQLPDCHRGEWSAEEIRHNRCHQAIFYKKSMIEKLGGYNLRYNVLADYDMNLKWFLNSRIKKKYTPLLVANYSDGGFSSKNEDYNMGKDYYWLLLKYSLLSNVLPVKKKVYYLVKYIRGKQMPTN